MSMTGHGGQICRKFDSRLSQAMTYNIGTCFYLVLVSYRVMVPVGHGLPVGQHYKGTISALCHKSVPVLI